MFLYGLMTVRGIRDKVGLTRFTWRVVMSLVMLLLLIIGYAYAFNLAVGSASWLEILTIIGVIFFVFITYTSFIPDFAAMFLSLNTINTEYQSDRIDLIRTSIGEVELVRAKHALAVVRSWRFMIYWLTARIMLVFIYVAVAILMWRDGTIWDEIPPELIREVPILLLVWIPLLLFVAVIMFLEPIWRMRVIAAIGVLVSARTENRMTALIFGVLGLFTLSMAIGFVSSLVSIPLSMLFGFVTIVAAENEALFMILLRVFIYLVLPLLSIGGAAGLYFFYRFLRRWLLDESVKAIERH